MAKIARDSSHDARSVRALAQGLPREVILHKKDRTVHLGEHVTLLFEDELTIRYQVQEMLRVEKIFEEAASRRSSAPTPLVPDGRNFKATMLIEYEDVDERHAALASLKGIEDRAWVQLPGSTRVRDRRRGPRARERGEDVIGAFSALRARGRHGRRTEGWRRPRDRDRPSHYSAALDRLPAAVRDALVKDLA
jgi:hypothetical protein